LGIQIAFTTNVRGTGIALLSLQEVKGGYSHMRKTLLALPMLGLLVQWGCSPAFWGGTAVGALGTGAGYEINSRRQMDRLEDDRRSGRISSEEYRDRKQQIERGSIIY
jgi:hypothetical protein